LVTMPIERIAVGELTKGDGAGERLRDVARRVLRGAVFIYPTETIYGIGGIYGCDGVRERIVAAKRRPADEPMLLVAGRRRLFDETDAVIHPAARLLASRFWPGRLTLVVPSATGEGFVGIRESDHPFLTALAGVLPQPLYSTSANLSGEPYRNDIDLITRIFTGSVDFVVDAGNLPPSPPSTVVRVGRDGSMEMLREGAVEKDEIEAESSGDRGERCPETRAQGAGGNPTGI